MRVKFPEIPNIVIPGTRNFYFTKMLYWIKNFTFYKNAILDKKFYIL